MQDTIRTTRLSIPHVELHVTCRWLIVVGLAIAAFLAYEPMVAYVVEYWATNASYQHAWLVILIVTWLIARAVPQLSLAAHAHAAPRLWVVTLLVASSCVWFLGYVGTIEIVRQPAVALVLLCGVACVCGPAAFRLIGAPIAACILILPVWDPLIRILHPLTMILVRATTPLLGFPVFIEGNFVMFSAGTLEIQEGCAGLRFVLAAAVLTLLAGEFLRASLKERIALIVGGIAAAIVLNCLRILVIAALAQSLGMQHDLVQDHAFVGDVCFALIVLGLCWVVWHMSDRAEPSSRSIALAARARGFGRQRALVVGAVLFLVPALVRTWDAYRVMGQTVQVTWPVVANGESREETALPWRQSFQGAEFLGTMVYRTPNADDIYVFVASYLDESSARELVGFRPQLADQLIDPQIRSTRAFGADSVVDARVVDDRGESWLVWHWYEIGSLRTPDRRAVKLAQLRNWFNIANPSTQYSVATRCHETCSLARDRLDRFLARVGEDLAVVKRATDAGTDDEAS